MNDHLPFPSEIRQCIYEFVFAAFITNQDTERNTCYISIHGSYDSPTDNWTPTSLDLSLLLVSRQTYLEAFDVFYRINQLEFGDTDSFHMFLSHIGQPRLQSITSVRLNSLSGDRATKVLKQLESCTNLKHLIVVVGRTHVVNMEEDRDKFEALGQFRGLRSVEFVTPQCLYPPGSGFECFCDEPYDELRKIGEMMTALTGQGEQEQEGVSSGVKIGPYRERGWLPPWLRPKPNYAQEVSPL